MWEQPFPLVSARFWTALTARAPKLGATGAEASGIAESHVTVMKRRASRTLLKLETAHVSRAPGWERLHVEHSFESRPFGLRVVVGTTGEDSLMPPASVRPHAPPGIGADPTRIRRHICTDLGAASQRPRWAVTSCVPDATPCVRTHHPAGGLRCAGMRGGRAVPVARGAHEVGSSVPVSLSCPPVHSTT